MAGRPIDPMTCRTAIAATSGAGLVAVVAMAVWSGPANSIARKIFVPDGVRSGPLTSSPQGRAETHKTLQVRSSHRADGFEAIDTQNQESAAESDCAVEAALTAAGQFEAAFAYSAELRGSNAVHCLTDAIYQWAAHDPAKALASAAVVADPAKRKVAFQAALLAWADRDPVEAAAYALNLPAGSLREVALDEAMPRWAAAQASPASLRGGPVDQGDRTSSP